MKLSKRERYAVSLAGAFIGLFITVNFIIFPVMDRQDRLKRMLTAKQAVLAQMQALKSEYDLLITKNDRSKARLEKRQRNFTLFSFLDKLAGNAGVKDHISYMKPSKSNLKNSEYKISMVEMKFQTVNMDQLLPYLYLVESSENSVFIRRVSITQAGKEEGFIDAVLQVETFEL